MPILHFAEEKLAKNYRGIKCQFEHRYEFVLVTTGIDTQIPGSVPVELYR